MTEIAALKAKLAAAEANNVTLGAACDNLKAAQKLVEHNFKAVAKERDEARSEAAALRDIAQDLCDFNAKYLDEMRSKETWAVEGTLEESPFVTRFRHALSQPGPGAALLERVRKLEEAREVLITWVKWWNGPGREGYRMPIVPPITHTGDVLAALEEKP